MDRATQPLHYHNYNDYNIVSRSEHPLGRVVAVVEPCADSSHGRDDIEEASLCVLGGLDGLVEILDEVIDVFDADA